MQVEKLVLIYWNIQYNVEKETVKIVRLENNWYTIL